MPTSLGSMKPYQGINSLWLSIIGDMKGFESPYWTTYNNAKKLGGNVRKGEKSTMVTYYQKAVGKPKEGEEKGRAFMIMKSYNVFNVSQCEGLTVVMPERKEITIGEGVKRVLESYNEVEITHKVTPQAFYTPSLDTITLPPLGAFHNESAYAETLFHELTHSTGHESRLNRFKEEKDQPRGFGSEVYAREELVAEIGASMLASMVGMEIDFGNVSAYIGSWLKALKDDRNLIIQASQRASKAVNYILGITTESESVE